MGIKLLIPEAKPNAEKLKKNATALSPCSGYVLFYIKTISS